VIAPADDTSAMLFSHEEPPWTAGSGVLPERRFGPRDRRDDDRRNPSDRRAPLPRTPRSLLRL
jgi:hypothetical protein